MIIFSWSNLLYWLTLFFISIDIALFTRLLVYDLFKDAFYSVEREVCISCPLYTKKVKEGVCDPECDYYLLPKNLELLLFFLVWLVSLIVIDPSKFINTFLPPVGINYLQISMELLLIFAISGLLTLFLFLMEHGTPHKVYRAVIWISVASIATVAFFIIQNPSGNFSNVEFLIIAFFLILLLLQNLIKLKIVRIKYILLTVPLLSLFAFFVVMVLRLVVVIEIGLK